MISGTDPLQRYQRQMLLPGIGRAGQEKLSLSSVLLIGCGALGCGVADHLVRAGIGTLRIVDRDIVELSNIQRQTLFDESDARLGLAKAYAASKRLSAVNSQVRVEAVVADVWSQNVEQIITRAGGETFDLIADGTDNVHTRYLFNDVSVKFDIPWVYGGAVGFQGRVMALDATSGPCLRCIFRDAPAGNDLPTCDTAGILSPASAMVAAMQATAVIQILLGDLSPHQRLISFDLRQAHFHSMSLADAKAADCPCCARSRYEFLEESGAAAGSLCGRDAVQIRPRHVWTRHEFAAARDRLTTSGAVEDLPFFARSRLAHPAGMTLTLFHDGRVLISGSSDVGRARAIYDRFIGS